MAKQQLTADEESNLKRQARRRLIGAIALTTAVVVILPMVFDGEPPASSLNTIELRIPDKDKVGEFQPVSAVQAESAPAVAVVESAPDVATVGAAATVGAVAVVAAVASQQVQTGKIEHPDAAKPAQTELKPKVEAKPKAEAKPKVETKPKVEAKPKVETKAVASPHAVPHSGFVVQIGAFSNPATAKSLQEKLGKQGFHVYTEKVGANIRVRAGSFPTREAAEKARHKLESQGLHPNVVNLGG